MKNIQQLEGRLNHKFRDLGLLREAVTHKSFVNENRHIKLKDNERLEFLGDAVLDLIISDMLLARYPDMSEGALSKRRASLVREETLCSVAGKLDLGRCILLGRGEEMSGGRNKSSLLANTFEALIASVYLDGGIEKAAVIVRKIFSPLLSAPIPVADYKTELQEICQRSKRGVPRYTLISERGPDHDKTFEVVLEIGDEARSNGTGKSIKEAEQMAAKRVLEEYALNG